MKAGVRVFRWTRARLSSIKTWLKPYCLNRAHLRGILGAPRSSVAAGAGLEPGDPRGSNWQNSSVEALLSHCSMLEVIHAIQ